jgi:hypothetical protein
LGLFSGFVVISQNRADAKRQVVADQRPISSAPTLYVSNHIDGAAPGAEFAKSAVMSGRLLN